MPSFLSCSPSPVFPPRLPVFSSYPSLSFSLLLLSYLVFFSFPFPFFLIHFFPLLIFHLPSPFPSNHSIIPSFLTSSSFLNWLLFPLHLFSLYYSNRSSVFLSYPVLPFHPPILPSTPPIQLPPSPPQYPTRTLLEDLNELVLLLKFWSCLYLISVGLHNTICRHSFTYSFTGICPASLFCVP